METWWKFIVVSLVLYSSLDGCQIREGVAGAGEEGGRALT